jgi:hypothetical protein
MTSAPRPLGGREKNAQRQRPMQCSINSNIFTSNNFQQVHLFYDQCGSAVTLYRTVIATIYADLTA